MACKTCALWDIAAARDRAGRVRSDNHVRCLWVSTEVYPIALDWGSNRPKAGRTNAQGGVGCPTYVERIKTQEQGK